MGGIALSEMIAELRKELLEAESKAEGDRLKLSIQEIQVELQVVTEKKAGGGGGVKFLLYNADAKVEGSEGKTQKLKLTLKPAKPADASGDTTFNVGDEDTIGR